MTLDDQMSSDGQAMLLEPMPLPALRAGAPGQRLVVSAIVALALCMGWRGFAPPPMAKAATMTATAAETRLTQNPPATPARIIERAPSSRSPAALDAGFALATPPSKEGVQ